MSQSTRDVTAELAATGRRSPQAACSLLRSHDLSTVTVAPAPVEWGLRPSPFTREARGRLSTEWAPGGGPRGAAPASPLGRPQGGGGRGEAVSPTQGRRRRSKCRRRGRGWPWSLLRGEAEASRVCCRSVGGWGGLPDSLALGVQVASNPSSLRAMLRSPSAFQGPSLLKQGAAQASAGTWRAVGPSWFIHATHLQHSVVRSREP